MMNWIQQFKQRVERENPQPESTPQSDVVFVRERQSDPKPPPKAASTDRKPLPSPLQLNSAYKWLTSANMEERIRGRCEPPSKCRFLIDWLSDELRKELSERSPLRWRDWNFLYDDLQRVTIANKPVMTL